MNTQEHETAGAAAAAAAKWRANELYEGPEGNSQLLQLGQLDATLALYHATERVALALTAIERSIDATPLEVMANAIGNLVNARTDATEQLKEIDNTLDSIRRNGIPVETGH